MKIEDRETLLDFKFEKRINEFRALDNKLIIEDVKIMNGSDAYVLAKDDPYLYYFKIGLKGPEIRKRMNYCHNPLQSKIKGRRIIFNSDKKIVFIVDSEDIYFMNIDQFLTKDYLENVGFKVPNTEAFAILYDIPEPRVLFAKNDSLLVNWNIKFPALLRVTQ